VVGVALKTAAVVLTALAGGLAGAALGPEPPVWLELAEGRYLVAAEDKAARYAVLELRARRYRELPVYLEARGESLERTAGELGLELDVATAAATLERDIRRERLRADGRASTWLARRLTRTALRVRVELPVRLDEAVAREALARLARSVAREPSDAALLIDEHRVLPSAEGQRLELEPSLLRLSRVRPELEPSVELDVAVLRPRVTEEDLLPVDVTEVLSSFETSFAGKAGPRAVNIRVAAGLLDGALLLPGETFSFNAQVGRRVHGRGFVDAPVIVNDELEQDVGGGVCQVASTLHAAAVLGNLTIVARRSHSRPSGYAPLGLDATVIDGKVDLKLRNPYDEALLVHTSFPARHRVRVELLGRAPSVVVTHASAVTAVEPFERRVWHKDELPTGALEQKQKGSAGMDVVSVLCIEHPGGHKEQRRYFSKYYPVPEVYHLGPGASVAALPPLAEGAVGLVVDGESLSGAAEPAGGGEASEQQADGSTEAPGDAG
jgi:vancomycin resistance protein YoaR